MSSIAEARVAARAGITIHFGIVAWTIVGIVTVMRAVAAGSVPLIGDEGYYWEWSRHLALGYADHPPGVAYVIFLFSWLGANPFAVRIGFVLCGLIATVALAKTATRLAGGDDRAGQVAALALTLTPLASIAFGSASPDGPYLAAWAVSLACAVRAFASGRRRDYVLLGVALGALLLTRMFAFAMLFGLAGYALTPGRRGLWRDGLGLAFAIAALCAVPLLVWNATHGWATLQFALVGRHATQWSVWRPFWLHAVMAAAYSPGLWIGALLCIVRVRNALVNWTAVPMIVLMTVLAFHEEVDLHWMLGAYLSLCAALGVGYVRLTDHARVIWGNAGAVPALILFPLIFIAAVAPGFVYEQFVRSGSTLRSSGAFEIFTVPSLAHDLRAMMDANHAVVVTASYGLSSTLDFYGGVPPVVVGHAAEGQESRRWYDPDMAASPILFVSEEPLSQNTARELTRACSKAVSGPTLGYEFHDPLGHTVPERPYFTTWCTPRPHALRLLRDPEFSPPA